MAELLDFSKLRPWAMIFLAKTSGFFSSIFPTILFSSLIFFSGQSFCLATTGLLRIWVLKFESNFFREIELEIRRKERDKSLNTWMEVVRIWSKWRQPIYSRVEIRFCLNLEKNRNIFYMANIQAKNAKWFSIEYKLNSNPNRIWTAFRSSLIQTVYTL